MRVVKYNKLVRDRIPEICLKNRMIPKTRTAKDDNEFILYLKKKVKEESSEIIKEGDKNKLKEEVADLLEALDALIKAMNVSKGEIRDTMRAKNKERGAFKKRVILLETKENPEGTPLGSNL